MQGSISASFVAETQPTIHRYASYDKENQNQLNRIDLSTKKIISRLIKNKTKRTYWDKIGELRLRPSKEVFDLAIELTKEESTKERIIGIDILAQLGLEERPFKVQTINRYFEILEKEKDSHIIQSLLYAIGHNNAELTLPQTTQLVQFKNHEEIEVRQGLVSSLLGIEHSIAIKTLIFLSNDRNDDIRNWATFGIASQIDISNKEILDALIKRTSDSHQETNYEAIVGLANRGDKRVLNIIIQELEDKECGALLFDAILALNDKRLIPFLERELERSENDDSISIDWIQELKQCIQNLKS